MIDIEKISSNSGELKLKLSGRLDTTGAPQLEEFLEKELSGIEKLTIDFSDLEYISSAGLRALLAAQKKLNASGGVTVQNSNEYIREIFDMTGFAEILTVE